MSKFRTAAPTDYPAKISTGATIITFGIACCACTIVVVLAVALAMA